MDKDLSKGGGPSQRPGGGEESHEGIVLLPIQSSRAYVRRATANPSGGREGGLENMRWAQREMHEIHTRGISQNAIQPDARLEK